MATVEDFILKLMEGKPADAGDIFDELMKEKIAIKVEERKKELAESLLTGPETTEDEEDEDYGLDDEDIDLDDDDLDFDTDDEEAE